MHIKLSKIVRAPSDAVFAWRTDLTANDSNYVEPLKSRRILGKENNIILLEDTVKIIGMRMTYKVRVTLIPPYEWIAEYMGSTAKATSKYRVSDVDEGTRLDYESNIVFRKWFIRILSPIISRLLLRIFSTEMDDYCRALEEELDIKPNSIKL